MLASREGDPISALKSGFSGHGGWETIGEAVHVQEGFDAQKKPQPSLGKSLCSCFFARVHLDCFCRFRRDRLLNEVVNRCCHG